MYAVKSVYFTLQGEGVHAGRAAVFCRFAGCNLWSGRDADRAAAACGFCDTDFAGTDGPGGGKFATADELADAVRKTWDDAVDVAGPARPLAVMTGGEPALQLDAALVAACQRRGFEVAIETNGTRPLPGHLDWVCVSPKAGTELAVSAGDELKLVYPQPDAPPERFEGLAFRHFWLQPCDGPDAAANLRSAAETCRRRPQWRLSLQWHKLAGLP